MGKDVGRYLIYSDYVKLPPSLTNMVVAITAGSVDLFNNIIVHFPQLRTLSVSVYLSHPFPFPSITLPDSLTSFELFIEEFAEGTYWVPFSRIQWPAAMNDISVNTDEQLKPDVKLSDWNLPRELKELTLSGVTITQLPFVWPKGLSYFLCDISGGQVGQRGMDKVWPDISRMAYYLPDSTICYTGVIDTTIDEEPTTITMLNEDVSGRPTLVVTQGPPATFVL